MAFQVIAKTYLDILMARQFLKFSGILFAAAVLPINLVLYLKSLKLSLSAMLSLKLAASSLK